MFARLMIALISAPYLGFLTMLTALPILAVGVVAMAVTPVSTALPVIWIFLLLVTWTAVYAQSARTAASVTGLKSLLEQPDFFHSFRQNGIVTVASSVLGGIFLAGAVVVYVRYVGPDRFWWTDTAKWEEAARLMETPEGQATLAGWDMDMGALPTILQIGAMALVSLVAVFSVPRAIRLRAGYTSAYLPALLWARLTIALPFFGMLAIAVERLLTIAAARGLAAIGQPESYAVATGPIVGVAFFTGMAFAFETLVLRHARENELIERAESTTTSTADALHARALRSAWSQR